jgi:hypothetical protein
MRLCGVRATKGIEPRISRISRMAKTFQRKDEKAERGQPQPTPELPADGRRLTQIAAHEEGRYVNARTHPHASEIFMTLCF